MKTVSLNKTVGFRVDLATEVRYKIFRWKTGRHKIRVHGDVILSGYKKKVIKHATFRDLKIPWGATMKTVSFEQDGGFRGGFGDGRDEGTAVLHDHHLLTRIHSSLLVDWSAYFITSLFNPKLLCSSPKYYLQNQHHHCSHRFRIENTNNEKGVYYDALNVTLYYAPNPILSGYKKKAIKHATFQDPKIPWGAAMKTVSLNKTVGFRVDLATEVRYKIFRWKTGRHKIRVHGDVSVDKQGKKTHKKPIKLKSAAPNSSGHRTCFYGFMVFLFVLLGPEFVEISLLF
ncbi:hypothetical protein NE237_001540 [Protea cynaroides]|uniref:Uncharacterized protein n=1 Tax=Protea cynaroides TaxID=273540 RepID=A0A9Q0KUC7_9MAGN|nr:hypothetical protein NE237_001540 [Protea cynaroides]